MSDYRRMEFPEYGFTIFKYRGHFYFEFDESPDSEIRGELRDNGFYYQNTIVHDIDAVEERWSRSSSENGKHGMKICLRNLIAWEVNKDYTASQPDYSYEEDLEDYFFN